MTEVVALKPAPHSLSQTGMACFLVFNVCTLTLHSRIPTLLSWWFVPAPSCVHFSTAMFVFAVVRETTCVTEIGPYKVPEGIVVWPMIYALQNSISNWDDPQEFNPVSDMQYACRHVLAFKNGSKPVTASMRRHYAVLNISKNLLPQPAAT